MDNDGELLRRYADGGDENAFAEIVRRYTTLVYSAALRVTNNPLLAEDATQEVFTKLVRHAWLLSRHQTLVGWLHATTRHTAIDALRSENRRRTRENDALAMQADAFRNDVNWTQLRPLIDEAVSRLNPRDREAVLLRFFNGLSHRELGAALGLSENSANKRVERALEKLRAHFNRLGITATSATLATTLSANSAEAAPADLTANVTKGVLASATVGGAWSTALEMIAFFMSTKTKVTLAVAMLAALVATITLTLRHSSAPVAAKDPSPAPASAPVTATVPPATGAATETVATSPAKPPAPAAPDTTSPAVIARKELNTTMDDIIVMLEAGDYTKALETYISPQTFADMTPVAKARFIQQMLAVAATPKGQESVQQLIQWLGNMKTQTPAFNEAGDRATYSIPNPPNMGSFPPELVFRKVEGKWYVIPPHSTE